MATGCGNDKGQSAPHNDGGNQGTINGLSSLMRDRPEFANASLKEIKDAAGTGSVAKQEVKALSLMSAPPAGGAAEAAPPSTTTPSTSSLDKNVAKEVQALIDKSLNEFDMSAQFEAGFKVMGIALNMQKALLADAKNSLPIKESAMATGGEGKELPTCQQFVADPFNGLPKDQIKALFDKNHENMKTSLSGCAEIKGGTFATCLDNLTKLTNIINNHATCDMNNFDSLTKIAEAELKMNFKEIETLSNDCMQNQFPRCGFKLDAGEKKPE